MIDENKENLNLYGPSNKENTYVEINLCSEDETDKEETNKLKMNFNFFPDALKKSFPIIYILPSIFGTMIYILTLSGCYLSEQECLSIYSIRDVEIIIIFIFISSFFYLLQIYLFVINKTGISSVFLVIFQLLFLYFFYDTGTDFKNHGAYNRVVLISALIIGVFMYLLLKIIYIIFIKKPLFTMLIIIMAGIIIRRSIIFKIEHSCDGWEDGFYNTKIQNEKDDNCQIFRPNICHSQLLYGIFDVSRMLGDTCDNMGTNLFSNIQPYLNDKEAKIIGYPRTEKWEIFPVSNDANFKINVLNKVINMEDPNISKEKKKEIEVTTNFYNNPPEVRIDLKKDEQLEKSRGEIFNKYKDQVLANNILYLFIDSLSRVSFKIKLPKLWNFLQSHYQNGDLPNDKNFETFQFFKYHGVGKYTGVNMVPAFFGVYNIYYAGKYFLTDYKRLGYITGQSVNWCGREIFTIDSGAIEHMKWDTYDHEMVSLFCDPNFTPFNGPSNIMKGVNSIRKRCLYNNLTLSYNLEYLKQFFEKYNNSAKFFRIGIADGHEGSSEVINYSDDTLYDFFTQFKEEGHLDDTLVIIHTDHGLGMLGPFTLLNLEDNEHESVLPAYYLIAPKNIKNYDKIRKNLKANENGLFTPFTTYNSLLAILNDKSVKYSSKDSNDIFNMKLSSNRDCDNIMFDRFYNDRNTLYCRCQKIKLN